MKEENGKKKKKHNIMRGVGKASLVMACVLGAFTLSGKMNLKPTIAYAAKHQDQSPSMEKSFFKTENPNASEIKALKMWATVLSKKKHCGDVAEKMISEECERFKNTPTSHPLQVVLIELLLDQGKYKEAKEKIDKLVKEGPAGVAKEKVYLLKAIAESESDPKKAAQPKSKAREAWENYLDELPSSVFSVKKMHPSAREIQDPKWATILSMIEECGDVVEKIISQECERFKNTPTSLPLQVLLIELLLDQEKYEEAKEKIDKLLKEIGPGPAGLPMAKVYLLKAIAEAQSDPSEAAESESEAKTAWENYLRKLSSNK
ncbi:hypothetical protein K1719_007747 [Acacia pycnantha]|nr:hypothetical protein K1719_007747 [Acacia pycnantha]